MLTKIKNIDGKKVIQFASMLEVKSGEIASKTLVQNDAMNFTLFAFAKDEEISTHASEGDAVVTILNGVARITIDQEEFILNAGDSIVMPAKHPHAVYAVEDMKMLLLVSFVNQK